MNDEQSAFDMVGIAIKKLDELKKEVNGEFISIIMYYDNLPTPGEFVFKVIQLAEGNELGVAENECLYFRSQFLSIAYYKCWEYFNKTGLIQESASSNFYRRRLIKYTHPDFVQWMNQLLETGVIGTTCGTVISKEYFLDKFLSNSHINKNSNKIIGMTLFTRWLNKWCDCYGFWLDSTNRDGNGMMAYRFKKKTPKIAHEVREGDTVGEFVENLLQPGYKPWEAALPFEKPRKTLFLLGWPIF